MQKLWKGAKKDKEVAWRTRDAHLKQINSLINKMNCCSLIKGPASDWQNQSKWRETPRKWIKSNSSLMHAVILFECRGLHFVLTVGLAALVEGVANGYGLEQRWTSMQYLLMIGQPSSFANRPQLLDFLLVEFYWNAQRTCRRDERSLTVYANIMSGRARYPQL